MSQVETRLAIGDQPSVSFGSIWPLFAAIVSMTRLVLAIPALLV